MLRLRLLGRRVSLLSVSASGGGGTSTGVRTRTRLVTRALTTTTSTTHSQLPPRHPPGSLPVPPLSPLSSIRNIGEHHDTVHHHDEATAASASASQEQEQQQQQQQAHDQSPPATPAKGKGGGGRGKKRHPQWEYGATGRGESREEQGWEEKDMTKAEERLAQQQAKLERTAREWGHVEEEEDTDARLVDEHEQARAQAKDEQDEVEMGEAARGEAAKRSADYSK